MRVINLEAIAGAPKQHEPYRHFIGRNAFMGDSAATVLADFPILKQTGFVPVDDLNVAGGFQDLVEDCNAAAFSAAVSDQLGLDLTDKPRLITVRHWSAAADGRIHTDSLSKIATFLIYLNETWPTPGGGCLRVLRNDHDFEDYSAEVSPVLGTVFGFRRAANSWHGHLPFVGERKVVQVTWLTDASKVTNKRRSAKISGWLKMLTPFRRGVGGGN